ncbi:hypothetical protein [Marinomonas ostreistagni]|uniref:hypothetical protein n=1 Tax=Marinomonas ostreistagni TaxID=359209 RepID=UPI00194FA76A|nr:hypothetical protein [Marinomonas ostreistagni]MBM6551399.1 hypothetical protein [Marinomonas ostreistagni]
MSKYSDPYNSGAQDSLSAFLDNEATPADIEALLASDMQKLAQKVDSYHQIHQSVQPDSEQWIFDSGAFLNGLHDKLDAGIEDSNVLAFPKRNAMLNSVSPEPVMAEQTASSEPQVKPVRKHYWSGLAVAASVAFAVVLGGNVLLDSNDGVATPNFVANSNAQAEPLATASSADTIRLEDNERLQNYLRQHAQQASMTVGQGMIPMAKVVGYPQGNAQ